MFKIGGRTVVFSPSPPPLRPFVPSEAADEVPTLPRVFENDVFPAHTLIGNTVKSPVEAPLQDSGIRLNHGAQSTVTDKFEDARVRVESDQDVLPAKADSGRPSVDSAQQASPTQPVSGRSDSGAKDDDMGSSVAKAGLESKSKAVRVRKGKQNQRDSTEPVPRVKVGLQRPATRQSPRAKQAKEATSKDGTSKAQGIAKKSATARSRNLKASIPTVEAENEAPRSDDEGGGQGREEQAATLEDAGPARTPGPRAPLDANDKQLDVGTSVDILSVQDHTMKANGLRSAMKRHTKAAASVENQEEQSTSLEETLKEAEVTITHFPQKSKAKTISRSGKKKDDGAKKAVADQHGVAATSTANTANAAGALPDASTKPLHDTRPKNDGDRSWANQQPVVFDNFDEDDDLYNDAPPVAAIAAVQAEGTSVMAAKTLPTANKVSFALPSSTEAHAAPKPGLPVTPPPKTGVTLLPSRVPTPAKQSRENARYGIYSSDEEDDGDDGFEVVGEIRTKAARPNATAPAKLGQTKQRVESHDGAREREAAVPSRNHTSTKSSTDTKAADVSSRSTIKKALSSRRPRQSVLESAEGVAESLADRFGFSRSKGIIKAAVAAVAPPREHVAPVPSRALHKPSDGSADIASQLHEPIQASSPGRAESSTDMPRGAEPQATDVDLEGVISDSDGEEDDASDTLEDLFKSKRGKKRRASSKATMKKAVESGMQDARNLLPFRHGTAGANEPPAAPAKKKRQLELSSSLPGSDPMPSSDLSSVVSSTSTMKVPKQTKKATGARNSTLSKGIDQFDDYALPGGSTPVSRKKAPARKTDVKAVAPVRARANGATGSSRPRPRPTASSKAKDSNDWQMFDAVPAAEDGGDAGVLLSASGKIGKADETSKKRKTASSVLGESRQGNRGFEAIDEYHLEVERI